MPELSGQIEKLSGRKLINTATDYEVELRLIENKEGNCNLLLKLYTFERQPLFIQKGSHAHRYPSDGGRIDGGARQGNT